jgi:hypothetical protein
VNDDMLELSMWRDGNIMHENCLEDMNKLKAERDEARRKVCMCRSTSYPHDMKEVYEIADSLGWDCFNHDTLSQEVSQERKQ